MEAAKQRIAVEEEDVTQPQHHAGHRQRQHGEQMQQLAKPCEVAPLLLRPGQHHDQHCAHKGGIEAQLQGVGKGLPAVDAVAVKGVVIQRQPKVIGPELHQ
ncbi:hypothetical protein D3C75_362440 [compost metagenome]